ncbi:hypothetical protein GOODEAATRI_026862 [Goodea atripinnis]|uniref:Uncharacterized protein n=1 Tax=Goodea atripinnis TaxID=208336 RepID=A0ABV0PS03_9TELE
MKFWRRPGGLCEQDSAACRDSPKALSCAAGGGSGGSRLPAVGSAGLKPQTYSKERSHLSADRRGRPTSQERSVRRAVKVDLLLLPDPSFHSTSCFTAFLSPCGIIGDMGNSMGCVRPLREGDQDGAPTLSPKKRLRFRRKQKGNKNWRAEEEKQNRVRQRGHEPEEDDQEKEKRPEETECSRTVLESHLSHSRTDPHSNTLSPGSVGTSLGGLLSSRRLEATPTPSPAWRGVFCFPGEEDTVSAIIDVSSIPSQTTTTTPVNAASALGSTTPGGGRVCRVRETVQGVLEKPWIQKKGVVEKDQVNKDGGESRNKPIVGTPSVKELKGVVHIREVDGKLCVVRTVYPSDLGSPLWKDEDDVEVHKEPPGPSTVTGNILKVHLLEDGNRSKTSAGDSPTSSNQLQIQDPMNAFRLDSQGMSSLFESGYSSDLPLTSPETAGTTPSQTDWGGLTSSSSEKLDSTMESPLAPQKQVASKQLPQVCV